MKPLSSKVPDNDALLATLRESPDDTKSWQVYADWLLEQGEPWGEVIGAAARGAPDSKKEEATSEALLGEVEEADLSWSHGVIESFWLAPMQANAESPMHVVLERVLKHPAGHFVSSLDLGLPPDGEWHLEALVAAIAAAGPLPLLETLDMSAPSEHMDQESWRWVGDIHGLWAAAPNLKVLKLRGSGRDSQSIRLAPIVAPALETLIIYSGGLDQAAPVELGAAKLPSLNHLELLFGSPDYGNTCTMASLEGLLAGKGMPNLKVLGLKNSEWEEELIEAVARSSIVQQLEVLDLSMGVLWRKGAEAIVKNAPRFAHLSRLILDDNFFDEGHVAAIKAVLKNAEFGEQKTPDDFDGDEPYRYTTIAE